MKANYSILIIDKGEKMFVNNLKIALRNILKQKYLTFVNILSLPIGRTCCFLVTQFDIIL
jgi:hypothetical protein